MNRRNFLTGASALAVAAAVEPILPSQTALDTFSVFYIDTSETSFQSGSWTDTFQLHYPRQAWADHEMVWYKLGICD